MTMFAHPRRLVGAVLAAALAAGPAMATAETAAPPAAPATPTDQKPAAAKPVKGQAVHPKWTLSVVRLPGGNDVEAPVASFAELRFRGIVRQTMDLSCGAAALATLLKGYFGINANESDIIKTMLESASPEDAKNIATNGFSMLELKRYAESRGLIAGGFKSNKAEELRKLRAPVIALINSRGYNHFVVIRHVRGDEVAIADPVFGNRTEPLKAFAKRWDNVILVAVAPDQPVNAAFMEAPKGAVDPRAVQLFLTRSYSPALSYGPGDFY